VFGTEAFMVSTSAWVIGCSPEFSRLLVFMAVGRGSEDGCGWATCGISVVWMVV
jgi:hypothetical protein